MYSAEAKTGGLSLTSFTMMLTVAVTVVATSWAVTSKVYVATSSRSSDEDRTMVPDEETMANVEDEVTKP